MGIFMLLPGALIQVSAPFPFFHPPALCLSCTLCKRVLEELARDLTCIEVNGHSFRGEVQSALSSVNVLALPYVYQVE